MTSPSEAVIFRTLAEEVLELRDAQGVRGIARERSRMKVHVATAPFADRLVAEIAPKEIRTWLREMTTKEAFVWPGEEPRKLDRTTIKRAASLVSVIFKEAIDRDIIEHNPCFGVKLQKRVTEGDTVERWAYLTRDEQQAILDCPAIERADKLAMRFAWETGMRQGEMFSLELPDLVIEGSEPYVKVRYSVPHKGRKMPPKSGKPRIVPLMAGGLEAAREWLEMLPTFAPENASGLVFPSERGARRQPGKPLKRSIKRMRDIYALAGIKYRRGLHWHALRHTFASNLVAAGLRLEVIQVLMGHSSVTITQRYAHLGENDIFRAVRQLFGPIAVVAESVPLPPVSERTLFASFDNMLAELPS